MIDLMKINKIHIVGIGGIGTSALARIFLAMNKKVSGSDRIESETTKNLTNLGIKIFIGHFTENISKDIELLIYTEDITENSLGYIEIQEAKILNIPIVSYSKALGMLMENKYGIGVTGTNGKSTTTAILGYILDKAGLDPTVVVGSKLSEKNQTKKFVDNARLGKGKYFICEADEYHRHMLDGKPNMIIVTNIAEDHLDYYKDLADIKSAFSEYIKNLPTDGIVIYNADDHNAVEVCREAHCHKFTFGIHHYADLQAINIEVIPGKQEFDLHFDDELIGRFLLRIPGRFNVSNAIGACLAAIKLGVDIKVIKSALSEFQGIWRRFEQVGELAGKPIISDYGHHPAAISGILEAVREFYPDKKALFVFQPHHRSRTKSLFNEFVVSMAKVDHVIIPEIFEVAGREHKEDLDVSSKDLVNELVKIKVSAEYAPDLETAGKMIHDQIENFDLVILMGAGDIDLLAREIVKK